MGIIATPSPCLQFPAQRVRGSALAGPLEGAICPEKKRLFLPVDFQPGKSALGIVIVEEFRAAFILVDLYVVSKRATVRLDLQDLG